MSSAREYRDVRPCRVLRLTEADAADLAELAERRGVDLAAAFRAAVAYLLKLERDGTREI